MIKKTLITLILLVFCLLTAIPTPLVIAQNEPNSTSSSEIDPDTIKENIKKRIEQVIQEQRSDKPQKKVALLGTIDSITPNSIIIETTDKSIKQASISAQTVYVQTATNKIVSREDASIGDFVAALGFMQPEIDVLDARRLLILGKAPAPPPKTSFYGSITAIDTKKNRLELTNPSTNETKLFSISPKSPIEITQTNSPTTTKITLEELNLKQLALVIYTPATASTSAHPMTLMLVKSSDQSNGAN